MDIGKNWESGLRYIKYFSQEWSYSDLWLSQIISGSLSYATAPGSELRHSEDTVYIFAQCWRLKYDRWYSPFNFELQTISLNEVEMISLMNIDAVNKLMNIYLLLFV